MFDCRTFPAPAGLIVTEILHDISRVERFRSAKRDWQMKSLPTIPERPSITLDRGEYQEVVQ